MLIVGIEPEGETRYVAAAPCPCGKTNSPLSRPRRRRAGRWTVGDDIAWPAQARWRS
jgi:GTP-dependent phosphoenolpyruvate carboxykinase